MVNFFINYYKRTSDGDLRTLMEVILNLAEDSNDQASWNDWNNAVKKALQNKNTEKFTGKFVETKLTELQAFNAMVKFLEIYYKETGSDFMGGLLGLLLFLPDGGTVDPAFWIDWEDAMKKILLKSDDGKQIDKYFGLSVTELQAFKAMVQFFKDYYARGPEPEVIDFFDYLHLLPDDRSESSVIKKNGSNVLMKL